jgi:D-hexose-6-phosphate mutarotase
VRKDHSRSTIVWNPWIAKARAMPDFGDDEWRGMVCVETANVGSAAVTLHPGEQHRMTVSLAVESH